MLSAPIKNSWMSKKHSDKKVHAFNKLTLRKTKASRIDCVTSSGVPEQEQDQTQNTEQLMLYW